MNKIHKWLIHKLGGVCSTDLAKPTIINRPVDIIPVQAVIRTEKIETMSVILSITKKFYLEDLLRNCGQVIWSISKKSTWGMVVLDLWQGLM